MTELVAHVRNLPEVQREQAITAYLTSARDRLTDARAAKGPAAVALLRAEVATVAEMTKQLNLSRECREEAREVERRCEFDLKKAIRKGQAEGTVETEAEARQRAVATREVNQGRADQSSLETLIKPKPTDFATHSELYGVGKGIMHLDSTDEQFEEALTEARAEGNLSRANVVRKVQGIAGTAKRTREQTADEIERLAQEGMTSAQIAARIGSGEQWVRRTARDYDIEIRADIVRGKRERINSRRILSNLTESLEAAAFSIRQIDAADLNEDEALEWVDSLTESLNTLRREVKKIKESFHD